MTEADTCREFVTPKLVEAGWGMAESVIGEQHGFTNGRIIVAGGKVRRGKQRRADYLLYYRRDFPLAVVEAKELGLPAETGVQQARDYAEMLGLKFAYATNGHRIIEIDYTAGTEREVDRYASPDELWQRLREMRDAAGDAGEFYTPRPVVRFMVQVMDPCLGETVLDPACGTGGFLVEAYDHIAPKVTSPDQRRALQRETLFGQEAKPLPYMLVQMNLLLHGLEAPRIAYGNTLERRINEIGHSERVDVILTNPPFGGEEEVGIKANFPPNMQTAETALLFLQYIMRKLRVAGAPVPGDKPAARGGRAAVVVPNGTLFGDGISAVIKEELLKEFRLHTIVRLPQGVFAPYTDIPANLLFFERGGPTNTIWYYELPLPEGRKKYSKTAPLQFEEFAAALAWWNDRQASPQAWAMDFAAKREAAVDAATPHWQKAEAERNAALALGKPLRELEQAIGAKSALQDRLRALKAEQLAHEQGAKAAQAQGDAQYWPIYNLDIKNPIAKAGLEHADPKDLIASMRGHEAEVMRLLGEIEALVNEVQA